jgi:hypothetical protein
MRSQKAVSDQPSAIGAGDGDPLADAHCQHCGYSLRGLSENRCPECGTAFDPAVFAITFLPQWPRLMAWYLAACVAAQIRELLPSLLRWNPHGLLIRHVGHVPLREPVNIMHLCAAALTCLLGPVCIIGLHRRRDWARKGCILIFVTTGLFCLSALQVLFGFPSRFLDTKEIIQLSLSGLSFVGFAAQSALVAVCLATGLRRKSLRRRAGEAPPELSRALFHPRHDWLLLFVLLLCGLGIPQTLVGIELVSFWLVPNLLSATAPITQGFDLSDVQGVLSILIGAFTMATAFLLWRRPALVRTMIGIVVLAMVGFSVFQSVTRPGMSPTAGTAPTDVPAIALDALSAAAVLLPYLVLLLFAFKAVSRDDIRRLATATKGMKDEGRPSGQ